jgi:RimJ/RimL family protein N-acetyltransferase
MKASTKTTLPILPSTPPTLRTTRLLLRPFSSADLPFYIVLRRQPEVMKWTSTARCDETIAQTEAWMTRFLPSEKPNTFTFCIEELDNPGGAIGCAGVNLFHGKQPEIGYMLRKEMWGKGYATEALEAVLKAYWRLKRTEVDVEEETQEAVVDQAQDAKEAAYQEERGGGDRQIEILLAVTEAANAGSRRVLDKFGFVKVKEYRDLDTGGTKCVNYILRRPDG